MNGETVIEEQHILLESETLPVEAPVCQIKKEEWQRSVPVYERDTSHLYDTYTLKKRLKLLQETSIGVPLRLIGYDVTFHEPKNMVHYVSGRRSKHTGPRITNMQ